MESFWSAYGLFVAKTITLLALIVGALVASARLLRRKSGPREPQLQVKNLNDKYQAMADTLHRTMLPNHDLKHYLVRRRHDDILAERGGGAARPRVFVLEFKGDLRASAVRTLREEITAVLTVATPKDEVFVRIESKNNKKKTNKHTTTQHTHNKQTNKPLVVA